MLAILSGSCQMRVQFHDFFLVRKFAAGRLALVGCLLRSGIIEYPSQLHQRIDVMSDICLHYLLGRMDQSFNQVELDITAHCNFGNATDSWPSPGRAGPGFRPLWRSTVSAAPFTHKF